MPTYDYKCNSCNLLQEVFHSIKETPEVLCPRCAEEHKEIKMERLISLNRSGGFFFKQWTESQVHKISRDKRKQNTELEMRQIERYGSGPKLQPNVAGVETESWSDASKLASEAGLSTTSYEPLIAKESTTSKISGIDDRKWKAAKEAAV
jgi:putative FmdB family regulatory protein